MSATVSSYMRSGGGTVTRNADILPFPFPARPQAMTGYLRFVESGNIALSNSEKLITIGGDTVPRLLIQAIGGVYNLRHQNGILNVASTMTTAPSVGQIVELVSQLNADGSVKLIQSIDAATEEEASASTAAVFSAKWNEALLYFNSESPSARIGFTAFRNVVFHRGVQSLTTMRRLAGVI